jgi:hypothetical protein
LPLADWLQQSVDSRLAGYEDVNDAERLSQDPTFRLIGSEKSWERGAALTSRVQSFGTEMFAEEENFAGWAAINRELIARVEAVDVPQRLVLDMDSTESSQKAEPLRVLTRFAQEKIDRWSSGTPHSCWARGMPPDLEGHPWLYRACPLV